MHAGARLPTLSLITPVLNAARLLPACLEAADQPDCEHILVDGGSTDGSRELIMERASPRIRLIRADGAGIYAAQNIGIAAALGEWCYFLGADDHLVPGAVGKLIAAITGLDIAYARVRMSLGYIPPHFSPMQQSWIYRRSMLMRQGGFGTTGLAEIAFNRSISALPHLRTNIDFCLVSMGGVSGKPRSLLTPCILAATKAP